MVPSEGIRGERHVLPLGSLVSVAQMATVGEIQAHQPVVWLHNGLVCLEVGRASTQALDVDTPLLGIQSKGLESTLLAQKFYGIDVLIATIVTSTWITLRVLVGHGRAKGVKDGAGSDILGGNEKDGLALALDFAFLFSH